MTNTSRTTSATTPASHRLGVEGAGQDTNVRTHSAPAHSSHTRRAARAAVLQPPNSPQRHAASASRARAPLPSEQALAEQALAEQLGAMWPRPAHAGPSSEARHFPLNREPKFSALVESDPTERAWRMEALSQQVAFAATRADVAELAMRAEALAMQATSHYPITFAERLSDVFPPYPVDSVDPLVILGSNVFRCEDAQRAWQAAADHCHAAVGAARQLALPVRDFSHLGVAAVQFDAHAARFGIKMRVVHAISVFKRAHRLFAKGQVRALELLLQRLQLALAECQAAEGRAISLRQAPLGGFDAALGEIGAELARLADAAQRGDPALVVPDQLSLAGREDWVSRRASAITDIRAAGEALFRALHGQPIQSSQTQRPRGVRPEPGQSSQSRRAFVEGGAWQRNAAEAWPERRTSGEGPKLANAAQAWAGQRPSTEGASQRNAAEAWPELPTSGESPKLANAAQAWAGQRPSTEGASQRNAAEAWPELRTAGEGPSHANAVQAWAGQRRPTEDPSQPNAAKAWSGLRTSGEGPSQSNLAQASSSQPASAASRSYAGMFASSTKEFSPSDRLSGASVSTQRVPHQPPSRQSGQNAFTRKRADVSSSVSDLPSQGGKHARSFQGTDTRSNAEVIAEFRAGRRSADGVLAVTTSQLSRPGDFATSMALFKAVQAAGIRPNVITYNAAISACSAAGRASEALALLAELKDLGQRDPAMSPTLISYSSAISACDKAGQADKALSLLTEVKRLSRDDPTMRADGILYSTVISACIKADKVDKALRLLAELNALARQDPTIRPNIKTHTLVISACGRAGRADDALALLNELKGMARQNPAMQPDRFVYTAAIAACAKGGRHQKADALRRELDSLGRRG